MIYWQLFWSFFQIGLFSFGGGYAAMPLIQNQVVEIHGWLTLGEFTDLITISQMTPGPIAINSATFVGMQIAGLPGAIIATIGNVLPSCIIVSLLAWLYTKYKKLPLIKGILSGLRPAVVALIASAGLSIIILAFWGQGGFSLDLLAIDFLAVLLFSLGFFLLRKKLVSPMIVMLGSGLIGGILYSIL